MAAPDAGQVLRIVIHFLLFALVVVEVGAAALCSVWIGMEWVGWGPKIERMMEG